jgi:hypothetical protein
MRHGRLDHGQAWAQYSSGQLPAEIGRSMGRPPDAGWWSLCRACEVDLCEPTQATPVPQATSEG